TEGRISIAESTLLYVLTAGLIVSWPWAVYVILNFFFWPYVMIDQGASSIMALKYAATIIRGEKVQLLIILTPLLGIATLIDHLPLGTIVITSAMPFVALYWANIYLQKTTRLTKLSY